MLPMRPPFGKPLLTSVMLATDSESAGQVVFYSVFGEAFAGGCRFDGWALASIFGFVRLQRHTVEGLIGWSSR